MIKIAIEQVVTIASSENPPGSIARIIDALTASMSTLPYSPLQSYGDALSSLCHKVSLMKHYQVQISTAEFFLGLLSEPVVKDLGVTGHRGEVLLDFLTSLFELGELMRRMGVEELERRLLRAIVNLRESMLLAHNEDSPSCDICGFAQRGLERRALEQTPDPRELKVLMERLLKLPTTQERAFFQQVFARGSSQNSRLQQITFCSQILPLVLSLLNGRGGDDSTRRWAAQKALRFVLRCFAPVAASVGQKLQLRARTEELAEWSEAVGKLLRALAEKKYWVAEGLLALAVARNVALRVRARGGSTDGVVAPAAEIARNLRRFQREKDKLSVAQSLISEICLVTLESSPELLTERRELTEALRGVRTEQVPKLLRMTLGFDSLEELDRRLGPPLKLKVPASDFAAHYFFVPSNDLSDERLLLLHWQVKVQAYDLNFSVVKTQGISLLSPQNLGQPGEENGAILPSTRISSGSWLRGFVLLRNPGLYAILFDNSFSFFREKNVKLYFVILREEKA